jgi:hypothetical protein
MDLIYNRRGGELRGDAMGWVFDNWLLICVLIDTALLVVIALEGRHVPERLLYVSRRLDKLERVLLGRRERQEGAKLISDQSTVTAAEATVPPATLAQRLRAGKH